MCLFFLFFGSFWCTNFTNPKSIGYGGGHDGIIDGPKPKSNGAHVAFVQWRQEKYEEKRHYSMTEASDFEPDPGGDFGAKPIH